MPQDDEESVHWSQSGLIEAYQAALDELDEFDALRQLAAINDQNPYEHPEVQEQKVRLHVATMRVFRRLPRVELREKLPQYWEEATICYISENEALVGLKVLEGYQGAVYSDSETIQPRHGMPETVEHWDAYLLPDSGYRRVINLITEVLERFGYIEAPNPPEIVYEMDAHGGEEQDVEPETEPAAGD